MDAFIELLPILFLLAYYLLGRKRKQLQKRRVEAPTPEGEVAPPTPFEEFVRQMEEAMRDASGETQPKPEPVEIEVQRPDEPLPSPMPVATTRPVTSAGGRKESGFRSLGSFGAEASFESSRTSAHEKHGFGLDQPFSEERFESLARGRDITEHLHPPLAPRHHAPLPATRASAWRQRLQNPKQAQDALVLTEIFSGPWSPRRPGRK